MALGLPFAVPLAVKTTIDQSIPLTTVQLGHPHLDSRHQIGSTAQIHRVAGHANPKMHAVIKESVVHLRRALIERSKIEGVAASEGALRTPVTS